jgi:glycerophosphoryl diester phosphodiesterase
MTTFNTLTGEAPLVIGHRGSSGMRPEHTLASYELAIKQGADFVEPDLVATRDGFLIARHENLLATVELDDQGRIIFDDSGKPVITQETSNVAQYDGNGDGAPDFADRLTVKTVDGVAIGGWFAEDFTLAEIKALLARERIPDVRPDNTVYNDQFDIPLLSEVIRLVQQVEQETGRQIGIYPETKHPTYFASEGRFQNEDANGNGTLDDGEDLNANGQLDIVNGGEQIGINLGRELIKTLVLSGFTDPERIFIQSFEVANLIELQNAIMPAAGVDIPLVQLYDEFEVQPYDIVFNFNSTNEELGGDPSVYDVFPATVLKVDGETTYGDLIQPDVLHTVADLYAEGIGPWKNTFILREPLATPVDGNGDGEFEVGTRLTGEIVPVIQWAHEAGLQVHPYTFRNEERFLTIEEDGTLQSPEEEYRQVIELGVDGFFSDFPGTAAIVVGSLTPLVEDPLIA